MDLALLDVFNIVSLSDWSNKYAQWDTLIEPR